MVENLFQIVTKSNTFAPHRYSLVLLKIGCPVGISEWLPVSKEFFYECAEGEIIEVKTRRMPMTVDEAHKYVAGHAQARLTSNDWKAKCDGTKSCGIEEYDPQQV